MRDPLSRLKLLPWRSLFQVAILTQLVVIVLEFSLSLVLEQSAIAVQFWKLLFEPPLGMLTSLVVAMAAGALGVIILERMGKVAINVSNLWALFFCLFVILLVRRLIPVLELILSLDDISLTGIIIGMFWKARGYWR
jgi:hypothetical protein